MRVVLATLLLAALVAQLTSGAVIRAALSFSGTCQYSGTNYKCQAETDDAQSTWASSGSILPNQTLVESGVLTFLGGDPTDTITYNLVSANSVSIKNGTYMLWGSTAQITGGTGMYKTATGMIAWAESNLMDEEGDWSALLSYQAWIERCATATATNTHAAKCVE